MELQHQILLRQLLSSDMSPASFQLAILDENRWCIHIPRLEPKPVALPPRPRPAPH